MKRATSPYVESAIRPHVAGYFSDMLKAVIAQPVMLQYLDQKASVGPESAAGKKKENGLNENFARELLELHTLGVGGPNSQADVTELAELLGAVRAAPGRGQDGDGRAAVLPPPAAGPPSAGTVLHVLGSAGTIRAGRITSIAEPDGTGSPVTAGLALIGRAGPILRRMGDLDLELELEESPGARGAPGGRLDPLDGLRVLVGSTGTVGTLRTLPCRRLSSARSAPRSLAAHSSSSASSRCWTATMRLPHAAFTLSCHARAARQDAARTL